MKKCYKIKVLKQKIKINFQLITYLQSFKIQIYDFIKQKKDRLTFS